MTLLSLSSCNSMHRVTAQCSGGHGFDSCWVLRFFRCPMLTSRWSVHFSNVYYLGRVVKASKPAFEATSLLMAWNCPSRSSTVMVLWSPKRDKINLIIFCHMYTLFQKQISRTISGLRLISPGPKNSHLPFHSQDLNVNSPYCLPHISYFFTWV